MDCLGLRVPGHYIWVTRKIGTVGGEMHTTDAMVGKPSGTLAERFWTCQKTVTSPSDIALHNWGRADKWQADGNASWRSVVRDTS